MKKKKKIIIAVVIVLILILAMGCGGNNDTAPAEDGTEAVDTTETENEEAEPSEAADTGDEDSNEGGGLLSPEFKKTMDDYEAWFDHYCEVMKKYQENPTDLELMSEMTDLLTEENEMLEQMEAMDESEMNDAELAYYIEVTARIEKKLLEVADY